METFGQAFAFFAIIVFLTRLSSACRAALGEAKIAYDVAKYGVKFAATFKDCFQNKNMTFGEAFVAAGKEVGVEIIIDKGVAKVTRWMGVPESATKNIGDSIGAESIKIGIKD